MTPNEPPQLSDPTRPPWSVRAVVTVLALGAWFWTQALIGARPDPPPEAARTAGILLAEHDRLLMLIAPLHDFLHANHGWANAVLIASSLIIDVLSIFLLLRGTFGPSIRPLLGLVMLFVLRQLCQALCVLPPPGGKDQMIWHDPNFPSLLVTYGVSNDLFFSGHTALAVFGALELARLGRRWLPIAAVIIVFEIGTVLALWAHYTMDVYAGAITALAMFLLAGQMAPTCDRALLRLGQSLLPRSSSPTPVQE